MAEIKSLYDLEEEYEDLLVRMSITSYADNLGRKCLEESKRLNDGEGPIPPEAEQDLSNMRKKLTARAHRHAAFQTLKRVARVAAVILVVTLFTYFATMYTAEATKGKRISVIIEWCDDMARFGTNYTTDPERHYFGPLPMLSMKDDAIPEQSYQWLPDWVVEGYEEESRRSTILGVSEGVYYRKSEEEFYGLELMHADQTVLVSIDYGAKITDITVKGHKGYMVSRFDFIFIIWCDGEYQFEFMGTSSIGEETALRLAESMGF